MSINALETLNRIVALTGHSYSIEEALDQWEHERELTTLLYAENQKHEQTQRLCSRCVQAGKDVIGLLEKESGLFLSPKTRQKIKDYNKLIKDLEDYQEIMSLNP